MITIHNINSRRFKRKKKSEDCGGNCGCLTLQTNIPYEFKIPKKFQEDIAVGMRLIVPLTGDRRVQGFIKA